MKFVEPIGPNRKFGAMGHPSRGAEKERILDFNIERGTANCAAHLDTLGRAWSHRAYSFFGFAPRVGISGTDSSTPSEMLSILSNGRVYGQVNSVGHFSFRLESYTPGA
jgi:hypothetical protein